MAHDIEELMRGIAARRYRFCSEKELQASLAVVLEEDGIVFRRECRLSERDQIDFIVGDVGIEVKTKGGLADLTRQVVRYMKSEEIGSVLVVTTLPRLAKLPASFGGKRIYVLTLLGSLF